ncbi:MAG: L-rhamnose/proton symporter RhaT [Planctomycetes bacterium]|nr:L-rhamnose/proton symporter RhaT [Planctomycetota bacterium]
MPANPLIGVVFHWLGGLASGSFYVPYRGVRRWAWEVYWLAGGVFSWVIAPWILALLNTNDLFEVLRAAPASCLWWTYFWGAMWGIGGLTFGLTMRYLGMSLGMAVALGFCAAFGTLMPPLFHGEFATKVLGTTSGLVILIGVVVCLLGIAIAGLAGMAKERELSPEQKRAAIAEFHFGKGIAVATLSGIMSSCFAYGLDAGSPIGELTKAHGTEDLWTGLPKLCVLLLGGFTSNFLWCLFLQLKNGTLGQYLRARDPEGPVPLVWNYAFSALAGTTWYMQFFFYTMGETQMGDYKFSSWTLHMASIILFSSMWGIALREWRGSSGFTKCLLGLGLFVLVFATVIVGFGNYLAAGTE